MEHENKEGWGDGRRRGQEGSEQWTLRLGVMY